MSTEAILAAATHHAELTSALEPLQDKDLSAELKKLQQLILDLERDIRLSKKELDRVIARNRNYKYGLTPLRESTSWRLAYTLTGRKKAFEKKASQEEAMLMRPFLEEMDIRERIGSQELLLAECQASRSHLEKEIQQLTSLASQLDSLYGSVFTDSASEHPEEDAYKQQSTLALAAQADLDARHRAESQALQFLEAAETEMVSLCAHYKESLPIFYATDNFYKKQVILEKARRMLAEAQNLVIQAKYIQPDIQLIPPIPPTLPAKEASETAATALKELKNQIAAEKGWIKALRSGQEQAEKDVKQAREDLKQIRKAIFERIVSQGSNLPPEYEE